MIHLHDFRRHEPTLSLQIFLCVPSLKTNIAPEKWMVGIRSFPFSGPKDLFSGVNSLRVQPLKSLCHYINPFLIKQTSINPWLGLVVWGALLLWIPG